MTKLIDIHEGNKKYIYIKELIIKDIADSIAYSFIEVNFIG